MTDGPERDRHVYAPMLAIDPELWGASRAGARAGRGFHYQDAVGAMLALDAWSGAEWSTIVPEGLDDLTLHGTTKEWRVQVKARHDPRGQFASREIAEHLTKSASSVIGDDLGSGRVRIALILERSAAEIAASGWTRTLGDDETAIGHLSKFLDENIQGLSRRDFLKACHLIDEPDPISASVATIIEATGALNAAARIVAHGLRFRVGQISDQNFAAPAAHPGAINAGDVQREVDRVFSLVDPQAVHPAVALGLCEAVDFSPVQAPDFYQGVDAVPGHVAAGLVLGRPDLERELGDGLKRRRAALVAGPSGSGKSAAAWLFAESTRHTVRWYRIRRVNADQTAVLLQMARDVEASETRPVGFVFDDLGRDLAAAWDGLVTELRHEPGVLLLGTIREEDILLVTSLAATAIARPRLDEALAERIHRELSAQRASDFLHWREPFEKARGLLLEYVHLLTSGQRLQETLDDQVRRRLAEGRDVELEILQAVTSVARHGGAADGGLLRSHLGLGDVAFARALARLSDEHAVRIGEDGSIGGLHELRSNGLHDALRRFLPTVAEDAASGLPTLRVRDFPVVLPRLLRDDDTGDDAILNALAKRAGTMSASQITALLHGLGLVLCERIASGWCALCEEIGFPEASASFGFTLALSRTPTGVALFAKVDEAIGRLDELVLTDIRAELLSRAGILALPKADTLGEYHELTAALAPISLVAGSPIVVPIPDIDLLDAPLDEALAVLTTVREFGVQQAVALAEAFGGSERLLKRIHLETAWVTKPLARLEDGKTIVRSDVRYVAPKLQGGINEIVVAQCVRLAAALPECDVVESDAVGWDGRPAGMADLSIATKRLERAAMPAPVHIAWNRAILRAIQRRLGTATETERSAAIAVAIKDLEAMLGAAADAYCRGIQASKDIGLRITIRGLLNDQIKPPSSAVTPRSALEAGEYTPNDDAMAFVNSVTSLARVLADGSVEKTLLKSAEAAELSRSAEALRHAQEWKWLAEAPMEAMSRCSLILADVEAVLGDAATDPDGFRASRLRAERSSKRNSALPRFAADARERAADTARQMSSRVERRFIDAGFDVVVASRPTPDTKAVCWPRVDHALLVRCDSILHFFEHAERAVEVTRELPAAFRVWFAPLREGFAVAGFALQKLERFWPDFSFAVDWGPHLPVPLLPDLSSSAFSEAMSAVVEASALLTNADRPLNDEETAYASQVVGAMQGNLAKLLQENNERPSADLLDASELVLEMLERVKAEFEPNAQGGQVAADFAKLMRQEGTDLNLRVANFRMMLIDGDAARAAAIRDGAA